MDKTTNTDIKSVSKSRRNLIKASAAAPVVASLHPGAAMAQSSAFHCTKGESTVDYDPVKDSNSHPRYDHNNPSTWDAVRVKIGRFTKEMGYKGHVPYHLYLDRHDNRYLYDEHGTKYETKDNKKPVPLYRVSDGKLIASDFYKAYNDGEYVHVLVSVAQHENSEPVIDENIYWPKVQDISRHDTLAASCWTSINPNH